MKSTTRTAMDRLTAARPGVAERTDEVMPRAERARLLQAIVDSPPVTEPRPLPVDAGREIRWQVPPSRRPRFASTVAAAVLAIGGVAGAVLLAGDDPSQVTAGPTDGLARFAPGVLPGGVQLEEVVEQPPAPPLAGDPYLEVYGRMDDDGDVESVVAVLTATSTDAVERILADSGAAVSEPSRGVLDIDFGQGLVAQAWTDDGLSVMVMGRGPDGGPGAVSMVTLVGNPATPADRITAPQLLADSFTLLYEGDQLPLPVPGTRTTELRYGDGRGEVTLNLRVEHGIDRDPASVIWQYRDQRPVEVRGHSGVVATDELGSLVLWRERPGLSISLDARGLSDDEVVSVANAVEEVSEDDWQVLVGSVPDLGGPVGPRPSGPESVLTQGEGWTLVAYEIDDSVPAYAQEDYCVEVRPVEFTQSCVSRASLDEVVEVGSHFVELGPRAELDGRTIFTGIFHPGVASVRVLFDTGETLEVDTVGVGQGFGAHLALTLPEDVSGATVVLLDDEGKELQRQAFPDLQTAGG